MTIQLKSLNDCESTPMSSHICARGTKGCEKPHEKSTDTFEEFEAACKARRLTYANEWYHDQLERLFEARDGWKSISEATVTRYNRMYERVKVRDAGIGRLKAALAAYESTFADIDHQREKRHHVDCVPSYEIAKRDARIKELESRPRHGKRVRDMTLTTELKNAIQRLRHWHDLTVKPPESQDVLLLCGTIERWSREGQGAPPIPDIRVAQLASDFRDYIEKHHRTDGGHFDCDECSMIAELTGIIHALPEPPAPDKVQGEWVDDKTYNEYAHAPARDSQASFDALVALLASPGSSDREDDCRRAVGGIKRLMLDLLAARDQPTQPWRCPHVGCKIVGVHEHTISGPVENTDAPQK